jgi:hypothetical protein
MPTLKTVLVVFVALAAVAFEVLHQGIRSKMRPGNDSHVYYPPTADGLPQHFILSDIQKSFFQDNGYVVVRGALDSWQVEILKNASDSLDGSVPGPYSWFMNNPSQIQRGFLDFLTWGPSAKIASALMRSDTVRLVLDYSIYMDIGASGAPWLPSLLPAPLSPVILFAFCHASTLLTRLTLVFTSFLPLGMLI